MQESNNLEVVDGVLYHENPVSSGHWYAVVPKPIPVGGPFHRVAVDVLQLPLTANGNSNIAVFMDCLMKWLETFVIPD